MKKNSSVLSGEKCYPCPQCGRRFSQPSHRHCHLRTHTGEKPYQCAQCDKRFSQSGTLYNHLKTHTGEKPFRCPQCGRLFSRSVNLAIHLRTHTREKPYQCPHCDKLFSWSYNLTVHLRVHERQKPCPCPHCGKHFSGSSNLAVHLRIHTGEKPFVCKSCSRCFSSCGNRRMHERTHTDRGQDGQDVFRSGSAVSSPASQVPPLPVTVMPLSGIGEHPWHGSVSVSTYFVFVTGFRNNGLSSQNLRNNVSCYLIPTGEVFVDDIEKLGHFDDDDVPSTYLCLICL